MCECLITVSLILISSPDFILACAVVLCSPPFPFFPSSLYTDIIFFMKNSIIQVEVEVNLILYHVSLFLVNKQLADKERVAAALENSSLLEVVNQCLTPRG